MNDYTEKVMVVRHGIIEDTEGLKLMPRYKEGFAIMPECNAFEAQALAVIEELDRMIEELDNGDNCRRCLLT